MPTDDSAAVTDHLAQARERLDRARQHLADGRLHKASRKGWRAAEHMAKAVAEVQGWEYERHDHFSVVLNNAYRLTGDDGVRVLRAIANELHGNHYRRKRHLHADLIGEDIEKVAQLLELLAPLTEPTR